MDHTLTRIDPDGENNRYPLQKQEIVTDPLKQEVNRSVYMGKLEYTLHNTVNWGHRNPIWPCSFGLSCCYMEMVTLFAAVRDVTHFGAEVLCASPCQAGLMVVAGTRFTKMMPVIRRLYGQVLEPKRVISMDACASPGGIYDIYSVIQGVDKLIPVDVYIPGYLPRLETYMQALMLLQESIGKERRPLSWMVGDQGVYRAGMRSERERKCGEYIAVTSLRTPDET